MVRRFCALTAFIAGLCHLSEWCSNGGLAADKWCANGAAVLRNPVSQPPLHASHNVDGMTELRVVC
jgi:hypothetical protein